MSVKGFVKKQDKSIQKSKIIQPSGCLQIQPNKFPGDFETIFMRRFNKTLTPKTTLILLPDGLYLILAGNYWAAMLIPEISDRIHKVNK